MSAALLVARLALAAVFATAAIAKLRSPARTAATLDDFRMPRPLIPASVYALPLIELGIAVLLVPEETAAWAALAAAALLATFSTAITGALARGEDVECNCFGAATASPVRRSTLARDAALFMLAAFVAIGGWN
jgi:uncharacterized membrane protein YphA (DoxX/SURF4 family)